jgi:hypothetical protein
MRTFKSALPAILAGTVATLLSAASAQAQATRTWVSGVGDDVNPCSRTAPCKTFAGAISKTAVNGEINCLDPGGFGALTVTKSITVDCIWIPGSVLNALTTAFIVNFNSFAATDTRKTVRIRGINMQGADSGTGGVRIIGGTVAGGVVVVEDSLIDGNFGAPGRGINDERTAGGELYVINTTIRNNGHAGIGIFPASGTGAIAFITNVRSVNNGNGGLVVTQNGRAMVNKSVFSGNGNTGVDVETSSEVNVDDSVMSGNPVGIFTSTGGILRVSNSTIALNTTAASGAWTSFGNNRVSGTPGTAPSAAGPASTDLGQK